MALRRADKGCQFQELAETEVLPVALSFCSGASLAALRGLNKSLAEALPASSSLWQDLLRHGSVWLYGKASPMCKARRLGVLSERCQLLGGRQAELADPVTAPSSKSSRHRLIVTGARRSGISTLVRQLAGQDPEPRERPKDMSVHNFVAALDGGPLHISVVDKRSTVIVTPLSAALYNGHTAALFVFDAGCMEDSLTKTAWCIEELRQTVGPTKFQLMPKLLVCHKADLLPLEAGEDVSDADSRTTCLPPMCHALLSTYKMDLVFTSSKDPDSAQLALALAAEAWPEVDPDDASRKFPVGTAFSRTRQQLRPTRTVVKRRLVVNQNTRAGSRPAPANLFEELLSRVPLAD
mmetsp:Transcript_53954/g.101184  ORF Transcript_53954/g.101184 Transcript_53954/m.101184 type:complete len:351 (-) Transcript_53954:135-1187(-)